MTFSQALVPLSELDHIWWLSKNANSTSSQALVPLSELDHIWWRFVFGLQIVPCLIAISLWIVSFPIEEAESPVWLVKTKKSELARNVLRSIKKSGADAERAVFKNQYHGGVRYDELCPTQSHLAAMNHHSLT